jgi:hypothetical protein
MQMFRRTLCCFHGFKWKLRLGLGVKSELCVLPTSQKQMESYLIGVQVSLQKTRVFSLLEKNDFEKREPMYNS